MRALLTLLICSFAASCAHAPPAAVKAVAVSRACEELASSVDGPEWLAGDNAKAVLVDTTIALDEANANLAATRGCQAGQREALGKEVDHGR